MRFMILIWYFWCSLKSVKSSIGLFWKYAKIFLFYASPLDLNFLIRTRGPNLGECKIKNRYLWCSNPSTRLKFWCRDPICKVRTWCMHFQRSYIVLKAHDRELDWKIKVRQRSMLTSNVSEILMWWTSLHTAGNFIYKNVWPGLVQEFKKVRQCQHWTHKGVCCGEQPVNLKYNACIFWRVTSFTMQFNLNVISKVQTGHTKVIVKWFQDFDVENISAQLQYYVCNSWWAIVLKRKHDLQIAWKFKKVRQWSMSKSSEVIIWTTSL